MFSKGANWVQKYFVIQGTKFFVYKSQNYNKPESCIELTEELEVREVRKKEADGKLYAFSMCPGKGMPVETYSAATENQRDRWTNAF